MFINSIKNRIIFNVIFILTFFLLGYLIFHPVYINNVINLPYILPTLNISEKFPVLWKYLKISYLIFYVLVSPIYSNFFYSILFNKKFDSIILPTYNSPSEFDICLHIGNTEDNLPIYIPKESLYQNILITGTIGTGKTSSAMYPFTKQLIRYQCQTSDLKLGMLILDVKGNYYEKVLEYAKKFGRLKDVIVIELNR